MTSAIEHTRSYYQRKIQALGPTPAGVDWGTAQAQATRFEQLLKLLPSAACDRLPSLNDLGCGYGALLEHMLTHGLQADYLGIDLVAEMVDAARLRFGAQGQFIVGSSCTRVADYSIASGLFNVCHQTPKAEWEDFILGTLEDLNANSRLGFAFNCLTSYSDADKMRDGLYYGDPLWFFDWCKRKYARNVALLHDYDLYDFTIIVRKETAFSPASTEGNFI